MGKRLHTPPTVVFSGGVGVPGQAWDRVRGMLAESGIESTVADRPGLSDIDDWSLGDMPTLASETERIAGSLRGARGAGPLVLVVHSAAGFFAEALALTEPSLADAVVLVDTSTTGDAFPAIPGFVLPSQVLGRLTRPVADKIIAPRASSGRPEHPRWEALLTENAAFRYWARDLEKLRDETSAGAGASAGADAVAGAGSSEAAPAIASSVVTAIPSFPAWWPGKRRASARMRRAGERIFHRWEEFGPSRHVVLEECGHMVMKEKPGTVYEEILRLAETKSAGGAGSADSSGGDSA